MIACGLVNLQKGIRIWNLAWEGRTALPNYREGGSRTVLRWINIGKRFHGPWHSAGPLIAPFFIKVPLLTALVDLRRIGFVIQ